MTGCLWNILRAPGRTVAWLTLAVAAAVLYGVLNDEITLTLAPEYFSVFKRRQFALLLRFWGMEGESLRLQAVLIGAAATWWFGLLLGVILSLAGTLGGGRRVRTRDFLRAVGGVMMAGVAFSVILWMIAYLAAPILRPTPAAWPFLVGIHDRRGAFAVGWWHNGAYLGALLGTLLAAHRVWRGRRGGLTSHPAISSRRTP